MYTCLLKFFELEEINIIKIETNIIITNQPKMQ